MTRAALVTLIVFLGLIGARAAVDLEQRYAMEDRV